MKQIIKKFSEMNEKKITRAHVIQSIMAGIYISLVFGALNSFESELSVASLGASSFIAFSFPNSRSSQPQFLIGGYFVGSICGLLCGASKVLYDGFFNFPGYVIACALAVFLSMILMTVLNFEHPPAVALAVAVTVNSKPFILVIAALVCVTVLCVIKEVLKKYLRDL